MAQRLDEDPSRPLSPHVLRELPRGLTGGNPDELPRNVLLLYSFKPLGALAVEMPLFDEWGLLPEGERHSPEAAPLAVRPPEDPGCVVTPMTKVGGAPPPVLPALASRQADVGGGDRSTLESAAATSEPRSRAAESPCWVAPAGWKRRLPEGGRPPVRRAPARKKWMAIDD